jgi:hypothetical protein
MLSPFYLLLLAEAAAAAGEHDDVRRHIQHARALGEQTGESCTTPRLVSWTDTWLREGG